MLRYNLIQQERKEIAVDKKKEKINKRNSHNNLLTKRVNKSKVQF